MTLYKLEDFATNYKDTDFDNYDIKNFDVYSDINDEKVGTVKDILVDDSGCFRYLVVDTGFWIFGKQVLLPIGRSRTSYSDRRIYATGLTREQVENLPDFHNLERVDYDYEEQLRGVYRTPTREMPLETSTPLDVQTPVESSAPLDTPAAYTEPARRETTPMPRPTYERETYTYDKEPDLYNMNEQNHQSLKLYEERLVANKSRVKTGEVAVGKHVETERAQVSVPIEKERVVIERTTPTDAGRTVSPGDVDFREGEVARVDIYEETPDIHKEAVLREEVRVKKVVEQDTVEAQETLRREELDINKSDESIKERRI
ncbi:DUF2382 domain-containing protein [Nostocaceae cyanobacterium CENA357]|uniref:DUF2382 domain-containing protein n=1 Tax=Atlanticothrix silvestris CENA357 TaxID=1725252 RepID=A0A8J7HD56_9CYAN|nr:DUF2382 domain-containing protein [Atlanticothrix silvestris]MBH8552838.1 DUF2382 domain-containing protein [Atlanticothrix silvestris CENA357]